MGSVKFFVALEPFETVLRIYWRTFMWYHLCIKDREVLTMEFQKLVTERFSVLEYERRDVAPELMQTILEAGLAAPTACNFQPQRIKVIQSDADRAALSRVVSSRYDVPLAFLFCYDRRACWIRPMDGKSSGDIDAAIVTTHIRSLYLQISRRSSDLTTKTAINGGFCCYSIRDFLSVHPHGYNRSFALPCRL